MTKTHELSTTLDLNPYIERINQKLPKYLPSKEDRQPLVQAIHYTMFAGGKRLRPILVYLTGETLSATLDELDTVAIAVECVHTYSLIHDDLPAMDNADTRRGQPSCHKKFDEATAVLVGDALLTQAFELLSQKTDYPETQLEMIATLSQAIGTAGMVGGQALDLISENSLVTLSQLETIHRLKTAALINACVKLGALKAHCKNETTLHHLHNFGLHLGLAFQIQDDILDVEGKASKLGKPTGQDQQANKSTYPGILGMAQAKKVLQKHTETALNALESMSYNTEKLKLLTKQLLDRNT